MSTHAVRTGELDPGTQVVASVPPTPHFSPLLFTTSAGKLWDIEQENYTPLVAESGLGAGHLTELVGIAAAAGVPPSMLSRMVDLYHRATAAELDELTARDLVLRVAIVAAGHTVQPDVARSALLAATTSLINTLGTPDATTLGEHVVHLLRTPQQ